MLNNITEDGRIPGILKIARVSAEIWERSITAQNI
jgi:hypothetical protein